MLSATCVISPYCRALKFQQKFGVRLSVHHHAGRYSLVLSMRNTSCGEGACELAEMHVSHSQCCILCVMSMEREAISALNPVGAQPKIIGPAEG